MPDLTDRQQEVLDAIRKFRDEHGYPPTVRELAALIGVSSPNGAHLHLRALAEKGAIAPLAKGDKGKRIRALAIIGDAPKPALTRADIERAVEALFKSDEAGVTYNRLLHMKIADENVRYGQSKSDVVLRLCASLGVEEPAQLDHDAPERM